MYLLHLITVSVAGWQMQVSEEQEVSELRTLVVGGVAVRHTYCSEEIF